MITFLFEEIEQILLPKQIDVWLEKIVTSEEKKLGSITYVFCDDDYLLKINQDYLKHDYYTDIITFDYVKGKIISGDIFVSLPRILDNASSLSNLFEDELKRVLAHGILHLCGYQDKTDEEALLMRSKEDYYLNIQ